MLPVRYVLLSSLFISALFAGFLPYQVMAQVEVPVSPSSVEEDELDIGIGWSEDIAGVPGTTDCFAHYSFGSVEARGTVTTNSVVTGTAARFEGTLENANDYPVVDVSVIVKVFKKRAGKNDGNGPDVVGQFVAQSDLSIPKKGSVPLSFSWKVPAYALTGEYEFGTFVVASDKFNLSGLSFTDDVVGTRFPFRVVGEQETGVSFKKDGVRINDTPYLFATPPPRIDTTKPVEVSAQIENTTETAQTVEVHWVVYQWDAQLRENAVQDERTVVTIPPGEVMPAILTVTNTEYPVYYVTSVMKWRDTKSFIGARFVRTGIDRLRFNFPGITTFPLVKGVESTLCACLHNTGQSAVVPGGELMLTLADEDGRTIHEYVYRGDVSGAMMGVAEQFTPKRTYDSVYLTGKLSRDGMLVDEITLHYDCSVINPLLCSEDSDTTFVPSFDMFNNSALLGFGVLLTVLLVVIGVLSRALLALRRSTEPEEELPSTPTV